MSSPKTIDSPMSNRPISPSELDISSITAADANTPAAMTEGNLREKGLDKENTPKEEGTDEEEEEIDNGDEEVSSYWRRGQRERVGT